MIAAFLVPAIAIGQPSTEAVNKIKEEGMKRSQAMKTMHYLTDVIGQRLTNSPSQRRANKWTKKQFEKWGLKNAKEDPWGEFGRSWELKAFSAHLISPNYKPVRAYPKAWSPSTNGPITGKVIYVNARKPADLEKYRGKLKGAIILNDGIQRVKPGFEPIAGRLDEKALMDLEYSTPRGQNRPRRRFSAEQIAAFRFRRSLTKFYMEEGAAVLLSNGGGVDSGTIRVMGASLPPSEGTGQFGRGRVRVFSKNAPKTLPQLAVEAEQYNRLLRLAKRGVDVQMKVNVDVAWDDSDLMGYNTIAEIPGTDLADEVVMIGAHLDSWHAGTGATDNGAGTTVVMEAMRILAATGMKPRRTIRVALWTGEEQGLLGSRAYVANNFGTREGQGPNARITKKPAYDKFAAYYNLDNGTGQIRGIYSQGNANARPIFRHWLMPFKPWGSTTTTISNTGGTDHLAFDALGLPGFQFIQDRIEYFGRTWHTTQDVADRMLEKDLKRSSIIMATFAYNSAMTDQKLPRKTEESPIASFLSVTTHRDLMEEVAFHNSNLDFSICGHELEHHEVPEGFPRVFALDGKHLDEHAAE